MGTIKILRGRGKYAKQFRFRLFAKNGKEIDPRDYYHNLQDLVKMINNNFPGFKIMDETGLLKSHDAPIKTTASFKRAIRKKKADEDHNDEYD